jgi:hypothetical protein
MDKLNIPRRTIYYYKKRLNEQSSHEYMKKEIEDLAFDMDTLRDRLIDLYAIAVNTIEDACRYLHIDLERK